MKNKKLILTLSSIAVIALLVIFFTSRQSHLLGFTPSKVEINPAFREYITGFSGGTIAAASSIKLQFNAETTDSSILKTALSEKLFEFQPSIKGSARWLDSQTLAFIPDEPLQRGKEYRAKFLLHKVLNVPSELKVFEWNFRVMNQHITVGFLDYYVHQGENSTIGWLEGNILFSDDYNDIEALKECISVNYLRKEMPFTITRETSKVFKIHIDSIRRSDAANTLTLAYNGRAINAEGSGKIEVVIPARGDFIFMNHSLSGGTDPVLSLFFSDELDAGQDLIGLISIQRTNVRLNYSISGNKIDIYLSQSLSGSRELSISSALINISGERLSKAFRVNIEFGHNKPQIRFIGQGVIIPGRENHLIPFEAVGLRAVNVKVMKIYENNALQFLQTNTLHDGYQINRVGKLVFNKDLRLLDASSPPSDLNSWNTYSLDLSDLIKTEPGCIYRLTLSMRREFTAFPCEDFMAPDLLSTWNEAAEDFQLNEWSYYDDDYDYYEYYYDYDWSQRENPCHNTYYAYGRGNVSRNILATDLGLLAKRGNDNSLLVFVNSITSSAPMSAVNIELYDYQQQLINSCFTNKDGLCIFNLSSSAKPFFIVAKQGAQRSYIRLNEGESLSLSAFDITGATVERGLKGFIYGERGVWRPGDTLFLSFILEDKDKTLPDALPVVLSLRNARNQPVARLSNTSGVNGFYTFAVPTDPDAPTGIWRAEVRAGGGIFTKSLRVETVKPNRLKIDLGVSEELIIAGKNNKIELRSQWLHGGKASELRAEVEVSASPMKTRIKGYHNFNFDDPSREFSSETMKLFEGKLDSEGKASFPADIKLKTNPPGMINLFFRTRVFERGGDFSIDGRSITYSPYETYAGVRAPDGRGYGNMLETQKKHKFDVVNISPEGKAVKNAKVKVEVYKIDWSWWWRRSQRSLAQYIQSRANESYAVYTVNIKQGKGSFTMSMEHGDWGRYLIRVIDMQSGHSCGQFVYFDYPGYRRDGDKSEMASLLSFQSDKELYETGETITLSIPSSAGGHALISIENGSRVISSQWIETKKDITTYSFQADPRMSPNIYIHISMLQPHHQTVNDLPLRLYGIIPLKVENPATIIHPVISAPDKARPESVMNVSVSEEAGKPMTYTLAVVDEGLLDLTRFKTPDPHAWFYAHEALGVKTWDIYDKVAGAYGAALQRILAIGGDGEISPGKSRDRAQRFKPMVRFYGPFELKKGERKSHTVDIPEYIGSVRVMVVAGQSPAYGKAEKTVEISKPLMVLGTLPRVAGPGEEILLPVSVFAADKSVKNVKINIVTNELFEIKGSKTQSISFQQPGEEIVFFHLKVKELTGVADVKISAESTADRSTHSIEMDVRNPNAPQTRVVDANLNAGEKQEIMLELAGMDGSNTAMLEITTIPPLDLDRRLSYLISYPYGCLEQIVSAAFPQLYLSELVNISQERKDRIEQNINHAIRRISSFQYSDGSFAYWPGSNIRYDWVSSYAGHFLISAEEAGYSVPRSMIDRWLTYQRKSARNWKLDNRLYNSSLVQAYRLYTLAIAGREELGAMNRLKAERNINIAARWQLAAAYKTAGYDKAADEITDKLTTTVPEYRENDFSFGNSLRDKAIILQALSLMQRSGHANILAREISAALSSSNWMNTQTTAYCILGLASYMDRFKPSAQTEVSFNIENQSTQSIKTNKSISIIPLAIGQKGGTRKLTVKNSGTGMVFVRVIMRGTPKAGEELASSRNIGLSVKYTNTNGSSLDPGRIKQGTDFIATVSISNPGALGDYKNLAISQIFPSGWEIRNERFMENAGSSTETKAYNYQDIRDDRVNTFLDLARGKRFTIEIMLNAAYAGRYYLPGVVVEAMYDNNIYATSKGQWVEVSRE